MMINFFIEINIFYFVSWDIKFYLFYCFKEESLNKILKIIFLSSSILFLLTAFLHEINIDIFLIELFKLELYSQFFIDFVFLIFSCCFYILYKKVNKSSYYKRFEKEVI